MIGPVMRPNVMTVFAVVFTMPIVSVLEQGSDAAAHRARQRGMAFGWLVFTRERLNCAEEPVNRSPKQKPDASVLSPSQTRAEEQWAPRGLGSNGRRLSDTRAPRYV